jgi:nucleotide-binding universal stress UspA family protein
MSETLQYKTILYATDLGDRMRPVLRQAIGLAQQYQANIIMLHVVEPMGSTSEAVLSFYLPEHKPDELQHEANKKVLAQMKQRLEKFCEEEASLCAEGSPKVSDVVVVAGHPAEEILHQAEKHHADLIIMGSFGKHILGRHVLGSTARYITKSSPVPVLIVPNTKDQSHESN